MGTFIREARTRLESELRAAGGKARVTQETIATAVGVAPGYISLIESGRAVPSYSITVKLSEALRLTPSEYSLFMSLMHRAAIAADKARTGVVPEPVAPVAETPPVAEVVAPSPAAEEPAPPLVVPKEPTSMDQMVPLVQALYAHLTDRLVWSVGLVDPAALVAITDRMVEIVNADRGQETVLIRDVLLQKYTP